MLRLRFREHPSCLKDTVRASGARARLLSPRQWLFALLLLTAGKCVACDIGSRWELFVDDSLIATRSGVTLKLNHAQRREVVLVTDSPWEGPSSAYFSVVQEDGGLIRLYYRGSTNDGPDNAEAQVTCIAESRDGIRFHRPKLGLFEVNGSKENNVIWKGRESHNFAPFIDTNPNCPLDARYKALGGVKEPGPGWTHGETPGGLYAFASPDGIHWRKLQEKPVMTEGTFDSLNIAFWDAARGRYACYNRTFINKTRSIQSSYSSDFLIWSDPVPNRYAPGGQVEHLYTNATIPCPGAEHLLLSFPKRFFPDRQKILQPGIDAGVSDAGFMSSHDGVNWDRTFGEAWARPGLDPKNWTQRSNMPARGIAVTAPDEWSFYISSHYMWPDNGLQRLVLPRHRLASVTSGANGGEFTTRPLLFSGEKLVLNYATSAGGSIKVELQNRDGIPLKGYTLDDIKPVYGDELDHVIHWNSGSDLSVLKGQLIKVRFVLQDADLFALRFAP